jgi:hypothetical protein
MRFGSAVAAAGVLMGCGGSTTTSAPSAPLPSPTVTVSPSAPAPTSRTTPSAAASTRGPVVVRYRIERRTRDATTSDFAATLQATLTDPRGWQRGDVLLVHDQRARFVVLLGEPDEVQQLCRPYDVYRRYSCQNGPLVALNAERWRHATPQWTASLLAYRQMLINHEVGHLLGLHHPARPHCPKPGALARVMAQQSTELDGCLPNPWPLPHEIALLARHVLPLAPPPN